MLVRLTQNILLFGLELLASNALKKCNLLFKSFAAILLSFLAFLCTQELFLEHIH